MNDAISTTASAFQRRGSAVGTGIAASAAPATLTGSS